MYFQSYLYFHSVQAFQLQAKVISYKLKSPELQESSFLLEEEISYFHFHRHRLTSRVADIGLEDVGVRHPRPVLYFCLFSQDHLGKVCPLLGQERNNNFNQVNKYFYLEAFSLQLRLNLHSCFYSSDGYLLLFIPASIAATASFLLL